MSLSSRSGRRLTLVPKLRLGMHVPEALLLVGKTTCEILLSHGAAKQSFAEVRSQAELGNEVRRRVRINALSS
jgi:hypothetical protein